MKLRGYFIGEKKPYRGFLLQRIKLPLGNSHVKLWDYGPEGLTARRFPTVAKAKAWARERRGSAVV